MPENVLPDEKFWQQAEQELSERLYKVLEDYSSGLTKVEISEKYRVANGTVENYISRLNTEGYVTRVGNEYVLNTESNEDLLANQKTSIDVNDVELLLEKEEELRTTELAFRIARLLLDRKGMEHQASAMTRAGNDVDVIKSEEPLNISYDETEDILRYEE